MSTEYSSGAEEPRDRTRWIWMGVIVLFVAAGAVAWLMNRTDPAVSRARVMHILIKFDKNDPADRAQAYDTIMRLRDRIKNGESFSALAKEYSNDPFSARRGGDLGYVKKGELSDEVEKYAWTAPLDELSEPIESPYGYHLVVVLDRYLAPGDKYQEDLEKRVLKEMQEEKASGAGATTTEKPSEGAASTPEAATPAAPAEPVSPPASIAAPPETAQPSSTPPAPPTAAQPETTTEPEQPSVAAPADASPAPETGAAEPAPVPSEPSAAAPAPPADTDASGSTSAPAQ